MIKGNARDYVQLAMVRARRCQEVGVLQVDGYVLWANDVRTSVGPFSCFFFSFSFYAFVTGAAVDS